MVSCQKCRQPISPRTFPHSHSSSTSLDESILTSTLSPHSTYDLLSQSERYPSTTTPNHLKPYYNVATNTTTSQHQRITVPPPHESFIHLPSNNTSQLPQSQSTQQSTSSFNSRLHQLSTLNSYLSSETPLDHPLCRECADHWVQLMQLELESGKRERDRFLLFEKEVMRKRQESNINEGGGILTREMLEKDIVKLKKAESMAMGELKEVERIKEELERQEEELEREEEELAREEAQFWTQHSKYIISRDSLQDRSNSLELKLSTSQRELEKLQKTNVYNDTFCIGQESGLGTINSLRLGRLPSVPVDWIEINAALGHVVLLLHTISIKFGLLSNSGSNVVSRIRGGRGGSGFKGWRLIPKGSFSRIERKVEEGGGGDTAFEGGGGKEGESFELYGSSDLSISRVLQNRRFDVAMVAFLECLRQLIEFVEERDGETSSTTTLRIPHRIVKDKIGDVSIKYQFGTDESWSRALRHVLLDLKILLGRASI